MGLLKRLWAKIRKAPGNPTPDHRRQQVLERQAAVKRRLDRLGLEAEVRGRGRRRG